MYVRSKVNLYLSGGYSRITECKDYDECSYQVCTVLYDDMRAVTTSLTN